MVPDKAAGPQNHVSYLSWTPLFWIEAEARPVGSHQSLSSECWNRSILYGNSSSVPEAKCTPNNPLCATFVVAARDLALCPCYLFFFLLFFQRFVARISMSRLWVLGQKSNMLKIILGLKYSCVCQTSLLFQADSSILWLKVVFIILAALCQKLEGGKLNKARGSGGIASMVGYCSSDRAISCKSGAAGTGAGKSTVSIRASPLWCVRPTVKSLLLLLLRGHAAAPLTAQ